MLPAATTSVMKSPTVPSPMRKFNASIMFLSPVTVSVIASLIESPPSKMLGAFPCTVTNRSHSVFNP